MQPFGYRLEQAMGRHGPLCVGIDPHPELLEAWRINDDIDGLRRFALTTVEALEGRVAALKPQAAFFERHGSRGLAALEEVIAACRDTGTLCIVDAKRGDIGSTMAAYATAYLGNNTTLAGDDSTLSPLLGFGPLALAINMARENGRGVFVLALTSNPEGHEVQHARRDSGTPVAGTISHHAGVLNTHELSGTDPSIREQRNLGSIGLVVGATVGDAVRQLDLDLTAVRGPLLAPGVGAQGAGPAELEEVFGDARRAVLASSSRDILRQGPQLSGLREAAERSAHDVAKALDR